MNTNVFWIFCFVFIDFFKLFSSKYKFVFEKKDLKNSTYRYTGSVGQKCEQGNTNFQLHPGLQDLKFTHLPTLNNVHA